MILHIKFYELQDNKSGGRNEGRGLTTDIGAGIYGSAGGKEKSMVALMLVEKVHCN
jgi:hypothetical protein